MEERNTQKRQPASNKIILFLEIVDTTREEAIIYANTRAYKYLVT